MSTKAKARLRFFLFIASMGVMNIAFPGPVSSAKATKRSFSFLPVARPVTPLSDSTLLSNDGSFKKIDTRYKAAVARLKQQADQLRSYLKDNDYNTEYCFLIDMSLPSGKKRFFIYNLKTNTVEESALVTHGIGSNVKGSDDELQFSNEPSSLQTSLGRYKIGSSYTGNFGLSYKLYGLDKTNSKAYERAVVMHAHHSIPTTETYPVRIGESFGCPSVAPSFLKTVGTYIKGSQKPIMMWIYN